MANKKISELPTATTIGAGDLFPVVHGGVTMQATPDLLPLGAAQAASVAATYRRFLPAIEKVPFTGFGHSYVESNTAGSDPGTKAFDRIAGRHNTQTYANHGVGGYTMAQILGVVRSNWTAGTRGLVGVIGVINDVATYNDSAGATTTAEAFRSILAHLSATYIGSSTDTGLIYGSGWTAGASSTSGSHVDLTFTGDSVWVLANYGTTAGMLTITNGGTTLGAITLGGYKTMFVGATKFSGLGTGQHTIRITLTSGTATIAGYLIPTTTPPAVVWCKEGPVLSGTFPATGNTLMSGTYHPACQTVANTFTNVTAIDATGWDNTTMLGDDMLHPNDAGTLYWTNRIENALTGRALSQGLNRISSTDNGASTYTPAGGVTATTVHSDTFESGVSGWTAKGTGAVAWDTTDAAHTGTGSLKITIPTVYGDGAQSTMVPVTAGTGYTVSFWLKSPVQVFVRQVIFYDSSYGYLSDVTDYPTPASSGWGQLSESLTAPAGAAFMNVLLVSDTPAAAYTMQLDDLTVTQP